MKRLFDIPVYYPNEKQLAQTHCLLKQCIQDCSVGGEPCTKLSALYYQKQMCRFNHIIGYIVILIDSIKNDICFEVYKQNTKELEEVDEKEQWFQDLKCLGQHFRYARLSNEEIRDRIKMFIKGIEKEYFDNRYADLEQFNNLIGFVDFSKL